MIYKYLNWFFCFSLVKKRTVHSFHIGISGFTYYTNPSRRSTLPSLKHTFHTLCEVKFYLVTESISFQIIIVFWPFRPITVISDSVQTFHIKIHWNMSDDVSTDHNLFAYGMIHGLCFSHQIC